MEFLIFWFLFAIVVGIAASSRGRSGFGWFLLSCLISPLLGLILVLVLAKNEPRRGDPPPNYVPGPGEHSKVPRVRRVDPERSSQVQALRVDSPTDSVSVADERKGHNRPQHNCGDGNRA
jgi:hypothetical protein